MAHGVHRNSGLNPSLPTALRDNRIELVRASWQELAIRISEVALGDEGQYTCSLFTMPVKTAKAFLTVLSECYHPAVTRRHVRQSLGHWGIGALGLIQSAICNFP